MQSEGITPVTIIFRKEYNDLGPFIADDLFSVPNGVNIITGSPRLFSNINILYVDDNGKRMYKTEIVSGANEHPFSIMKLSSGAILIFSVQSQSEAISLPQSIAITEVTKTGKVINREIIKDESSYMLNEVLSSSTDYFLVFCEKFPPGNRSLSQVYLFEVNAKLNIVSKRPISGKNEYINQVIKSSDGISVITGKWQEPRKYIIRNFDFTAELKWQSGFMTSEDVRIQEVQKTTDGGYIIIGDAFPYIYSAKLDHKGAVQWENLYEKSNRLFRKSGYFNAFHIIESTEGYMIIGSHHDNLESPSPLYVIKINEAGMKEWSRKFPGITSTGHFINYEDGCLVFGKKIQNSETVILHIDWVEKLKGIQTIYQDDMRLKKIQKISEDEYLVLFNSLQSGECDKKISLMKLSIREPNDS